MSASLRRPAKPILLCAIGLMSTVAAAGAAAPGDLDPTFDGDGRVTTDFVGDADEARAVAIQGDGRIVAAGGMTGFGAEDYGIARYRIDGSLDPSFDGDGKTTTDFFGSPNSASAVAIQADGKIVAGGGISQFVGSDFTLARYNVDGSLDTSFDGDGRVTTDFAGSVDAVRGLAIQADGKIVAAGFASVDLRDFALARYRPDGSLDTSFDGDGKLTLDLNGQADEARAVVIQTDGRIVTAGVSLAGSSNDFALARFNIDGSLDSTFEGDGKLTTDFFGDVDEARALALQGDGKLVAAGTARLSGALGGAVARYNSDGSLDSAFDSDGKVTTHSAGTSEEAYGVAIQADGKIVIAGCDPCVTAGSDFALSRYRPDGSLDGSFGGGDGKLTTDFGAFDGALAVVIQPDGKILASGFGAPSGNRDFALARYQSQAGADLAVTKTDPPGRAPTGRNLTYTLTVVNNGPDAASDVSVIDFLPPTTTLVSVDSPGPGPCSTDGRVVECGLGTLASGAMVTVEIVVKPTQPGVITNTTSVRAPTPDPNGENNSDSENTSVCRITSRRSSIPCG